MLDVDKLKRENELARQEINDFYDQNSFKNKAKEWIANSHFFSVFGNLNILKLFWPDYDNKEYGAGDSILEYILYIIFNFFIIASVIKLGFDFGIFYYVLISTLVFQIFMAVIVFKWQAILTNFAIYFCAIWLTTTRVHNAIIHDTYHCIENVDSTMTVNDFFIEQSNFQINK